MSSITVLQVKLDSRQYLNQLSFDIGNVPCNWSIQYYSFLSQELVEMTDSEGDPVGGTVLGVGSDQFKHFSLQLPLISTNLIEFHLDRQVVNPPTSPYGLKVRNIDIKLSISKFDDVPPMSDDIIIKSPLGHIEQLLLKNWDASKASDGSDTTYWKSSPQPIGSSIVSFFLDTRDVNGNAQLIDRLELDPTHTGPSMNVYYSNDDTISGSFTVARNEELFTQWASPTQDSSKGTYFNGTTQALTLDDNQSLRLELNQSWSIGATVTTDFTQSITTRRYIAIFKAISSTNTLGLAYDGNTNKFVLYQNDTTVLIQSNAIGSFIVGAKFFVYLSYTLDDGWRLQVVPSGGTPSAVYYAAQTTPISFNIDTVTIGNNLSRTRSFGGYIRDLWIKQDGYHLPDPTNPYYIQSGWIYAGGPVARTRADFNTVLLCDLLSSFTTRIGPDDGYYDLKTWTPVWRDYTLTKGFTYIPVTLCKFIKLEFTSLVAEPYPLFTEGVQREIKQYPQWVTAWYNYVQQQYVNTLKYRTVSTIQDVSTTSLVPQIATNVTYLGTEVVRRSDIHFNYSPTGQIYDPFNGDLGGDRVQYSLDLQARLIQEKYTAGITGNLHLSDQTVKYFPFDYNGEDFVEVDSFLTESSAALVSETTTSQREVSTQQAYYEEVLTNTPQVEQQKFYRTSIHEYDVRTVNVTYQQAYFVGLNSVKAWRVDYTSGDDTPEYFDSLADEQNLLATDFDIDPARGLVSTHTGNQFITKIFPSFSHVSAIQLAVQASEWESQLTDRQLSLQGVDHLNLLNSTMTDVSSKIAGTGHPWQISQVTPGTAYGIETKQGIFTLGTQTQYTYNNTGITYNSTINYGSPFAIAAEGVRTSGVVRLFLPQTGLGTYVLTLKAGGAMVTKQVLTVPVGKWVEFEVPYLTSGADVDFQVNITQTDTAVSEPFYIDFLGLFQNPVKWEVSNDGGTTWKTVIVSINNPNSIVTFKQLNNKLQLRATALRPGVNIASYLLVPWYLESPITQTSPVDYINPPDVNETDDLRATNYKPLFRLWDHLFPQRYSLTAGGKSPVSGLGFHP